MAHANNLVVVAVSATLLAAGLPTASLRAQTSTPHRVAGIVIDQARTPVPGAELTLRRGSQSMKTTSNDSGRFDFGQLASGPVAIAVHRLGFRERTVNVDVGSAAAQSDLEIDLLAVPADIEAVVIEGKGGRLQEFIEHRKQRKFGHFFDQNEIRAKSPRYVSELFTGIPGARLTPSPAGGSKLLLRGCRPKIWLDGVNAQDAEIDEVIAPSEIAGIEIYSSWAGIPAQYMDRENRACGAVLIWSRQS